MMPRAYVDIEHGLGLTGRTAVLSSPRPEVVPPTIPVLCLNNKLLLGCFQVECYGLDLDALYVNTGFRVAIMDMLQGPARLGRPSLCRFAGPEEFAEEEVKTGWFSSWSKKEAEKKKRREAAQARVDAEISAAETAQELLDAARAREEEGDDDVSGNWLWQLVTEVLPPRMEDDMTDILDEKLPPAHNRHRYVAMCRSWMGR